MDVIAKIKEVIDLLDEIDEYNNSLSDKLSIVDGKEQDLLHYLEEHKIGILWCYRYVKTMQENRLDRRKIKNDMELAAKYNEHKAKMTSKENRQFILAEIHKREKFLNMPYKNRQYSEDDMQNILKGV